MRISILVVLLIVCQYLSSKDIMNFYTSEQVESLNRRAMSLLKESSCKYFADESKIVYIFKYDYNGSLKKKDFIDHSFFSRLIPSTRKILIKDKEYIDANLLFEKKDGSIIGSCDAYNFYSECSVRGKSRSLNLFILDKMKELKITQLFMIKKLSNWPVIGVTDNKDVYVFDSLSHECKVFSLDEFIKNRPDSAFEKWDVDND